MSPVASSRFWPAAVARYLGVSPVAEGDAGLSEARKAAVDDRDPLLVARHMDLRLGGTSVRHGEASQLAPLVEVAG